MNLCLIDAIVDDLTPLASQVCLKRLKLDRFWPSPEEFKDVELDLTPLAALRQLEELTLSQYKLTRLDALNGLTRLRTLDLNDTNVRDLGVLQPLTALETVHVARTPVEDSTPLCSLPLLKSVTLPACAVCALLKARLPQLYTSSRVCVTLSKV